MGTIINEIKTTPITVDRMTNLNDSIQGGALKKVKLKQHPIFSQLDANLRLILEKLQGTLFLSRIPLTLFDESDYIIQIGRSGTNNINILLKGGFSKPDKKSTLDFFLLCESLFEEVPQDEIGAYDNPNRKIVNILED